jgi:gamma-glutamyltranspeptidase
VYLDKNGDVIKGEGGSIEGYRAAGVPGTVRGMELRLKKYGSHRLTWSQLIEPARRLAANGFRVTNSLARGLRGNRDYLSKYPETKRSISTTASSTMKAIYSCSPSWARRSRAFSAAGRMSFMRARRRN